MSGRRGPKVVIAAIIIANSETQMGATGSCLGRTTSVNWACVDVLGQSILGRVASDLKRGGIDSVFAFTTLAAQVTADNIDGPSVQSDGWRAAGIRLNHCTEEGFDTLLIADCRTYAEFDLADMVRFHREQGEPVSRAYAPDGPVDLWMIDPSRFNERENLHAAIRAANPACYELRGYVNRMRDARAFRRLILDSFSSRSRLRPRGTETRPGVWVADNAEVGHNARIVPPAFIGRGVRIAAECLITRGSNVECGSHIDFGTAVEDSSILPNTYLGIGLDLSHSVVDGKNLWNLQHNIALEITDPVVMRPNLPSGDERYSCTEVHDDVLGLSA